MFYYERGEMKEEIMKTKGFVRVGNTSDIPEGSMKTVHVNGQQILIANVKGKYLAIGAICKHEEWDLSEGTLEGHKVTCAGHGAIWDLETGKAEFDETLEKEPVYEVKVEGKDILVDVSARSSKQVDP